jgi:hypothetical protein
VSCGLGEELVAQGAFGRVQGVTDPFEDRVGFGLKAHSACDVLTIPCDPGGDDG